MYNGITNSSLLHDCTNIASRYVNAKILQHDETPERERVLSTCICIYEKKRLKSFDLNHVVYSEYWHYHLVFEQQLAGHDKIMNLYRLVFEQQLAGHDEVGRSFRCVHNVDPRCQLMEQC